MSNERTLGASYCLPDTMAAAVNFGVFVASFTGAISAFGLEFVAKRAG